VFKVDAPAGAVLESAVLYLHVANAQAIMYGSELMVYAYRDDNGAVQMEDFEKPSTYVGSSGQLGNLGDYSTRVDVLVSIDVTKFMRSAYDDRAPFVGFILGAGGAVSVWGIGDAATAPTLVSTFDVAAVPEPASAAMLATAVLAVGAALRGRGPARRADRSGGRVR
jgi:hypothetical protein